MFREHCRIRLLLYNDFQSASFCKCRHGFLQASFCELQEPHRKQPCWNPTLLKLVAQFNIHTSNKLITTNVANCVEVSVTWMQITF